MFLNTAPKIYYKKIGSGKPLILLHGNKENHTIFNELCETLKHDFTLYLIDSRGHGQSETVHEYHYSDMADDVIRLVEQEKIENPCVFGFSDGGIIALLCAIKAPDCFDKIITAGANFTVDGLKRMSLFGMSISYFITRDQRTKMMLKEPNISQSELLKIKCPALILAGENDLIKEKHTKQLAKSIQNSTLKIFPKKTHGNYIVHSDFLTDTIKNFI